MSSPILSPLTLRPPYANTPIVDVKTGVATTGAGGFDPYLRNLTTVIVGLAGRQVQYYGARGDGHTDDQPAFQRAVDDTVKAGGGTITVPAGVFALYSSVVIPATDRDGNSTGPITLTGQGNSTILLRAAALPVAMGLLDISSSNFSIISLVIDGNVLVSQGLQYSVDFNTALSTNDPMAPVLTLNTSVWLHGPIDNFDINNVQIQHTGGYAVLVDAFTGNISDVDIINLALINNRPHTFGTVLGQLIFGSWTGGVYINGDGRTVGSGVADGVVVALSHFHRGTGNQVWSHLYGLNQLHSNFRFVMNDFIDIGLDAIEPGGVTTGVAANNVFRRVGYVCSDDTSQSIPRWLPNFQATALDSSGLVLNMSYTDNSFLDINGGCIDGDSHGQSVFSGNVMRVASPGDPEYIEDQVAICGPSNTGQAGYGINIGNSSNTNLGAANITIVGNTFVNLMAGSVRLYGCRQCLVEGNVIISPAQPVSPPISIGPFGIGANQGASGNIVRGNLYDYSPAISAPFCFEDGSISPFSSGMVNFCYDNSPMQGNANVVEFQPDAGSGSATTATAVAGAASLNVSRGIVTTEGLTTAGAAVYTLTLTDPAMRATSNVLVTVQNGTNTAGAAVLQSVVPANGSVVIKVLNNAAAAFNGTLKIQFAIQ